MRSIPGLALGTYYAVNAEAARSSAHASSMRELVYLVKNNRVPPLTPRKIPHPELKQTVSVEDAPRYIADLMAPHFDEHAAILGLARDENLKLVPIPSSSVTFDTIATDRWPAYKLAQELARKGLAPAVPAVVNQVPSKAKTTGHRRSPQVIGSGYNVWRQRRPETSVLFIDDVLTHGDNLIAMDRALGCPNHVAVLVVALTDSLPVTDCFDVRRFRVEYNEQDEQAKPVCHVER